MPAEPRRERLPTAGALFGSLTFWLCPVMVIVVCGVLPTLVASMGLSDYDAPFRSRIFTDITRKNPVVLVFPLVSALAYVAAFWGLTRDRFLFLGRTRARTENILMAHGLLCAAVTFITLFLVALAPAFPAYLGSFDPSRSSLAALSPGELRQAEANDAAMSGLTRWGAWALPIVYACWVGLNAVIYGCMSLALSLLQANRLVALVAPWLGWTLAATAMAWLGLEQWSPDLVMPFNLSHAGAGGFAMSLVLPLLALVTLCLLVWRRREHLHGLR